MTQPTTYARVFNFTNFSSTNPADQQPGNQLDAEYNAIKVTIDQIRVNLALIQKDDTSIVNNSIGRAQLKAEVVAGINTPTTWLTGTAYTVRDSVIINGLWYWCAIAHTSGTFATDLAAVKWVLIYDFTAVVVNALLSSTTPAALGGAATAGVAVLGSRSDHVHALPLLGTYAEFAAVIGAITATVTSGTTAMTARLRYRLTGGTATLPTMTAGDFSLVELRPAAGITVTVARNSQTIDGTAADDTYTGDGGPGILVLYKFVSAGVVTSEIRGSVL